MFTPEQEEMNAHWDVRADMFTSYVQEELATERPAEWLKLFEENAPADHPLRVLDCGCGPGFFSIVLTRGGHAVTGVDGSPEMLDRARKNAAAADVCPEFQRADFGALPFPDNTFDLIVNRNVTHIIRDHRQVYGEWNRVLKPGGVLLIVDANWHLPYQPGPVREEAIRREHLALERYGHGYTHDGSYEYIDTPIRPVTDWAFLGAVRPDFDIGVLSQLPFCDISFKRDITEKLWSEKEKLMYAATPLFLVRAVKA